MTFKAKPILLSAAILALLSGCGGGNGTYNPLIPSAGHDGANHGHSGGDNDHGSEDNDHTGNTDDNSNPDHGGHGDTKPGDHDGHEGTEPNDGDHEDGNNGDHEDGNNGDHEDGNNGGHEDGNNGGHEDGNNDDHDHEDGNNDGTTEPDGGDHEDGNNDDHDHEDGNNGDHEDGNNGDHEDGNNDGTEPDDGDHEDGNNNNGSSELVGNGVALVAAKNQKFNIEQQDGKLTSFTSKGIKLLPRTDENGKQLDDLKVGEVTVMLPKNDEGGVAEGTVDVNGEQWTVLNEQMSYASFGLLTKVRWNNIGEALNMLEEVKANDAFFFAQGVNPTEDMPATGKAEYKGNAVYYGAQGQHIGDVSLTADFAGHTLDGGITAKTPDTFPKVDINAAITGNHFESADGAKIEVKGAFYGPQAAEAAGVFGYDDKKNFSQSYSGAFGAKKQ